MGRCLLAHMKIDSAAPGLRAIPSLDDAVSPEHPDSEVALSRDARRSRRKRPVRARTINVKRLSRRELYREAALWSSDHAPLPATRSECKDGLRPCPHVSCKYHLYLDVSPTTGAIKLNFPDLEVWELRESCALDIAERGSSTLEDVGLIMNLTRERVRQLETSALERLRSLRGLRELCHD